MKRCWAVVCCDGWLVDAASNKCWVWAKYFYCIAPLEVGVSSVVDWME